MDLSEFSKLFNQALEQVDAPARRTNAYRYFYSKNTTNKSRAKDKYFWTIPKNDYNGKEQYLSGVYRYNATTKTWTAKRVVGHAQRKNAKARALKLNKEDK